jgi:RND superfamily putative drug exporter
VKYRRPLAGLFIVLLACAVLGVLGLRVEEKLEPLSLTVPGTSVAAGNDLAQSHFGDSSPFAVLLRGPAAALDRQGIGLVRALRRDPAATVISPWDRGAVDGLRPDPHKALVLVDFHVPLAQAMRDTVPALERTLAARIDAPVVATESGFAPVARALQEESLSSTERAELLAAPLLVLVLLLVFRSVVAAAIPLLFGALTVFAGRGVLALLSSAMTIDSLSLVVCTMMGLALGVDYSLLIVSRFREELEGGLGPWEAAAATRGSAGRTTFFAGLTLIVALVFSAFLQPGTLLLSLAIATAVVALISVVVSVLAVPPLLALLGPRINAGRIGRRRPTGSRNTGWTVASAARAALRKPALAAAVVAVPLVLLMLPTLAFTTGAPGIDELPTSNQARQNAETIDAAVGPGWEAPFILVAATERGPITSKRKLALLARWQRKIAAEPGIRAVIGPAPLANATTPLRRLGKSRGRWAGNVLIWDGIGPSARVWGAGPAWARVAAGGAGGGAVAGWDRRGRRGERAARGRVRTGGRWGRVDRQGTRPGRRPWRRSDGRDRAPGSRQQAPRRWSAPDLGWQPHPGPRPALTVAADPRR